MADFAGEIKKLCGVDVAKCFQCRKCSSGCPVIEYMDITPSRMIRGIQAGRSDEALASKTIWMCASCYTCSARCPNDIDFARVADALRTLAVRRRLPAAEKKIAALHKEFMADVKRRGRVHEPTFLSFFKLRTLDLFTDLELGLAMFAKGKLRMLPKGVKDKKAVKAAFKLEDEAAREKP